MLPPSKKNDSAALLAEAGYSEKAIYYVQTQENMGVLEDANHTTTLTGPCGDTMRISLKTKGSRIEDAKIQVLGCPGAVASGCALMNLVKGKTVKEAWGIDLDALYREVEKLPEQKIHCARLAIKTLQKALGEYEKAIALKPAAS